MCPYQPSSSNADLIRQLKKCSTQQLLELFEQLPELPGALPNDQPLQGHVIVCPGLRCLFLETFMRRLWSGKVFRYSFNDQGQLSGQVTNHWTERRKEAIGATLSITQSRLDGRKALTVDYAPNSLAKFMRDYLRPLTSHLLVGVVTFIQVPSKPQFFFLLET
jgi:hypothetical protein